MQRKEGSEKMNVLFEKFSFPPSLDAIISNSPSVIIPESKEVLFELIFGSGSTTKVDVFYDVNGTPVKEADVVRCKNGASVNYVEDYMRRRDPDCMRISDDQPTDKPRFQDVYGYPFETLRKDTYEWLSKQELILVPFMAGGYEYGYPAVMVCPRNAAFFGFALSQLQAFVEGKDLQTFKPRAILYVAPPFRHTHFDGRQVCVHHRSENLHEIFAYNLYPGPSAKKGIWTSCNVHEFPMNRAGFGFFRYEG